MPNPIKYNATNQTIDQGQMDWQQTSAAKTIASGAITWTSGAATIDTQASAATDDLDTITATGAEVGYVMILNIASAARTVTVRHLTGNIWTGGGDILLNDIHHRLVLFWDGTYWCVIGGGGQSATEVEVTPDGGEDLLCVVAARLVEYVDYIMQQAADARAGGLIAVTAALTAAIHLAEPDADQNLINALALAIVEEYADDTAINAAFTTTVYGDLQCSLYCGNSSGDGRFYASDIPVLIAYLAAFAGVPYDLLEDLVTILGADGLTRAVGLSMLTASTADCSGDCGCVTVVQFVDASAVTFADCVVQVDVEITFADAELATDLTVAITTAGTATGGGDDYTLNTTTVTFPAGTTSGATQTVTVTTTAGADANETIILGLSPERGDVGANDECEIWVSDNSDEPGQTYTPVIFGNTWARWFNINSTNGLLGWSMLAGTLSAGGIDLEKAENPNASAMITRTIAVPPGSLLRSMILSVDASPYHSNTVCQVNFGVGENVTLSDTVNARAETHATGVSGLLNLVFYIYSQTPWIPGGSAWAFDFCLEGTGNDPFENPCPT
ncbi:MAG: hypothetical protein JNL42_00380 [Anaerolineae bacterium]|nr:hypothetical protein [Anaerolineae bacterium]